MFIVKILVVPMLLQKINFFLWGFHDSPFWLQTDHCTTFAKEIISKLSISHRKSQSGLTNAKIYKNNGRNPW